MKQKTYIATPSTIQRAWHHIDVSGKVLGRIAPSIAKLLMGKHKPTYTPNIESGDYVVVTGAASVVVTGNKEQNKMYHSHSGIPGGLHSRPFNEALEQDASKVITHAVKGMLPKNKQLKDRIHRLKVFPTAEHTYMDKFKKA
jgi:large subunit ribosomal protein L13